MRQGILLELRNLILASLGFCGAVGLLTAAAAMILQGDIWNMIRSAYFVAGAIGLLLAALMLMDGRIGQRIAADPRYAARLGRLPLLLTLIVISAALIGCGSVLDYVVR